MKGIERMKDHIDLKNILTKIVSSMRECRRWWNAWTGILFWADDSRYEGQFLNNIQNGYGIQEWPDERKYEGYLKNNQMLGKGLFTWIDIIWYEGDMKVIWRCQKRR
jgi:hypothetical protein